MDTQTKWCMHCVPPKERLVADFYRRKASKDGLSNRCKECESRGHQSYYKRIRTKSIHRKSKLRLNYNISIAQWNKMYREQGGACGVCKRTGHKLVVDHNHKTGMPRELLCSSCNTGLGFFKEDVDLLQQAINYLVKHGQDKNIVEDPQE